MRLTTDGSLTLSPTDLTTFAGCRHAARLELDRVVGRPVPERGHDPDLDLLTELGRRHEHAYLARLEADGLQVVRLERGDGLATDRVAALMRDGVDVIAQAALGDGRWGGYADVLRRVEAPSLLGPWRYEVEDTKLSRTTRTATVLQLLTYASLLERLQGSEGESVHVVTPGPDTFHRESLRVSDFDAVTRLVRERYEAFVAAARDGGVVTEPEPVDHCAICPWWASCRATWRRDDHLSLVAHLGRAHRAELERRDVGTRGALAAQHPRLAVHPEYGRLDTYRAAAHQASVQVASERRGEVVVERLPPVPSEGLARLPAMTPHDVYLDLEGTPFYGLGGLEYLWGWSVSDGDVEHVWCHDEATERAAFVRFVDTLTDHLARHPDAHAYHYGAYEVGALKRLMGRYGTREEEIDALLRREAFVDLLTVARQGFRVGVETYSLKDLERVHGYVRDEDLRALGPRKREVEHALSLGVPAEASLEARAAVERYNGDDVRSTRALHAWLERERERQRVAARPPLGDGAPGEALSEERRIALELVGALRAGLPDDRGAWTPEEAAKDLLADLVEFERREDKAVFWAKYQHAGFTTEELEASPKGLVGLEHVAQLPAGPRQKNQRHVYRFPPQDLDPRGMERLFVRAADGGLTAFTPEVDLDARTIVLSQPPEHADLRPTEGFLWTRVPNDHLTGARHDFARDVIDRGLDAGGRYRAARDLLLSRVGPGGRGVDGALRPGEDTVAAATRLALPLDGGVLPIQGPPGAGKTYTGARMILALVAAGQRVAVTAVSNKAVSNLLAEVVQAARQTGRPVRVAQRAGDGHAVPDGVAEVSYETAAAGLRERRLDVVGGTAWVWSREAFREGVDTLVIDEAGQLSLAAALSVATAARTLVLLGDPQQLTQPIQGGHPEGAEISALEHLLAGHATLPTHRGLFLDRTFRMAPPIAAFVSRCFYEDRLLPKDENARIALDGTDGFDGAGVSFEGVAHEGRDGTAPEEVAAARALLARLLRRGARFRDRKGHWHDLSSRHVMVCAPYNRHVDALRAGLSDDGLLVGTVDKLQGQERPIVIYALGVSTADLAPRGTNFLFDHHRFNVAISRAQARAVLVASPALFETLPTTPGALKLLNAHVRLIEAAGERS